MNCIPNTTIIRSWRLGEEDDGLLTDEASVSNWSKQDVIMLEENNKYELHMRVISLEKTVEKNLLLNRQKKSLMVIIGKISN